MRWTIASRLGLALVIPALAAGCAAPRPAPRASGYAPRVREITITTVPLLVRESARTYPFLARDFAKGGVLENKEVYAFSPSTIVAVEGDTLRFTFVNPEDDLHTFVLPGLSLDLPGQSVTHATYPARRAGVYEFTCDLPSHMPMMSGQLVVLSPTAVTPAGDRAAAGDR